MQSSFTRLGLGLILAVILVYLLMVLNFQSWLDPFIILMPLPVRWREFFGCCSSPDDAQRASLMAPSCASGVATANSILMLSSPMTSGWKAWTPRGRTLRGCSSNPPSADDGRRHDSRHVADAMGMGEGGEQNAPLGRAVIGDWWWPRYPRCSWCDGLQPPSQAARSIMKHEF